MRAPFVLFAVVALVLTPLAAGAQADQPRAMQMLAVDGLVALLSWSPVPGADLYIVYRGVDAEHMQPIGATKSPEYLDQFASSDAVYGIAVVQNGQPGPPQVISSSGGKGDCVSANSDLHVSITFANCLRD